MFFVLRDSVLLDYNTNSASDSVHFQNSLKFMKESVGGHGNGCACVYLTRLLSANRTS